MTVTNWNEKNVVSIAFTGEGVKLAKQLMEKVGGQAARSGRPDSLKEWTKKHFTQADALVIVGAVGIAVRAIAPHIQDKTEDPAVIVVDEKGENVIPILSGHLGGANDLAKELAQVCGGRCVITTATDLHGVFAVDEWAKHQDCIILEKDRIKDVSGGLLAGATKTVRSRWPITGDLPEGLIMTKGEDADIVMDIRPTGSRALHLVPKIVYLGIGCRRGTKQDTLESFYKNLMEELKIPESAIAGVATIDIKADEIGMVRFCQAHGWDLAAYSAVELEQVKGDFHGSSFVEEVTGVDNVCERSAVLAAGGGEVIHGKTHGSGVTMALAITDYHPTWEWYDE